MTKFLTNPPFIELCETNWRGWPIRELQGDLVFHLGSDDDDDPIVITIPNKFRSDLASAPRLLWWLFPPAGKWTLPAVLHDYLYTRKNVGSRLLADVIFWEAMKTRRVWWWQRILMYYAVRLFGWMFYQHKKPSK